MPRSSGELRVVVVGAGEMGSASGRLLFLAGFHVILLERAAPLAVRRRVAFADAVTQGRAEVEGVIAERVRVPPPLRDGARTIPLLVDDDGAAVPRLRPDILVDARMAKRNPGLRRTHAPLVIALGPGYEAGEDVHVVIETQRGPDLGRILRNGLAEADSGVPSPVLGVTEDRVLRAPVAGVFRGRAEIGTLVEAGAVVGEVGGQPVESRIGGLLRGLLADGVAIEQGAKVGDVDPRGRDTDAARISDKARAIASGVLEAVFVYRPA